MSVITDDELLEMTMAKSSDDKNYPEEDKNYPEEDNVDVKAKEVNEEPKSEASRYIGKNLSHKPGDSPYADKENDKKMIKEKHLTRIGETISEKAEYRDGWLDVDRQLLGERDIFYPADWTFKIRPATVDAIRNWSTLDEENFSSVDDVFNEILKSCLSIQTPTGPLPWGNVCSWDRLFFILLIREYTFAHGESAIKYDEDCIECDNPVTFTLTSSSLMYDMPDPSVMKYYDQESRSWLIDPSEFDLENEQPIALHVPTLERDANIKAWMIARLQENRNRKIDQTFIKFLLWLAPKISKDTTISNKQIKNYETVYRSWDITMFSFMDDVLRNIMVTPSMKLTATCPVCGEEMTSDIRFPNGIRDLFNVQSGFKKFGQK